MYLRKGDTIGFYSPSTAITVKSLKRTQRAIDYLSAKGFKLKAGKLTGKSDFYRSGSIQERAEELNELLRDPEVSCVMSTIGGYNSNSLLPYLDYETLKKDPKILIGYSDVTAILMAVYAKCGIPTFYGPALVATFGELPPFNDESFDYMMEILGEDRKLPLKLRMPEFWTDEFVDWEAQENPKEGVANEWITVQEGVTSGRLIIGNLSTIFGIWESPYMPKIKEGDILFIEESFADIADTEKGFAFLEINGIFDKISGLIIGKYEGFDDKGSHRMPYDVIKEILRNKKIPVLAQVDCCHSHPMFTLPIGGNITLDATDKEIILNSLEFK